jgi:hypothetical protein
LAPRAFERIINKYVQKNNLDDDDPLVGRKKRAIQYWVEDAAEVAAAETGDEDYRRVPRHDLRRCWANSLLIEEGISPCVVIDDVWYQYAG